MTETKTSLNKEINSKLAGLYEKKDFVNLEKETLKLMDENYETPSLSNYYGIALISQNKLSDASDLYEKLVNTYPNNESFYVNLAYIYMQLEEFEKSSVASQKVIEIKPDNFMGYYNYGTSLLELGNNSEAIIQLEKAIELNSNFPNAFHNLGNAYRNNNNPEKAIQNFELASNLNPDNKADIDRVRGYTLTHLGNFHDGLNALNKSDGRILLNREESSDIEDLNIKKLSSNEISKEENFIGEYQVDQALCNKIIEFFEANENLHRTGSMGWNKGIVNSSEKDSIDLTIFPNLFDQENYKIFNPFFKMMEAIYYDYIQKYELGVVFNFDVQISSSNIQKYNTGGHYKRVHCERGGIASLNKLLAWMTYLNDVEDGGETCFPIQQIEVNPQAGKTLIWPADWTHIHYANAVTKGNKYIITGWIDFSIE